MVDRENYEILISLDERSITFNNKKNVIAVEGDEYSQKLTFKCQRIFDDIDLSQKNLFINYETSNGSSDIVRIYIKEEDIDDDYIFFIWNLDKYVCNKEGKVTFSVNFTDGEDYSLYTKTGFFKVETTLRVGVINTEEEKLTYYTIINNIGDLNSLETDEKTTVVGAINETNDIVKNNIEEIERLQYYGDKNIVPTSQNDFTWTISNETATVTDYTGDSADVVIPYKYIDDEGIIYPVVFIRSAAFYANSIVKNIIIPKSVTDIDTAVFYGCVSLEGNVSIPDGITTIKTNLFDSCYLLNTVILPDSVTTIKKEAFRNCRGLTKIFISDNVISIDESAFSGCSNITIICSQGSYAETYAKENNIPYKYTEVKPEIGDLTELETTDKSSVVGAINEVNNKITVVTTGSHTLTGTETAGTTQFITGDLIETVAEILPGTEPEFGWGDETGTVF